MKPMLRVANPPTKPLMLYDGDCKFCTLWIRRWQSVTSDFVEYLPFQDPRGAARFPEISHAQFDDAVQLILPDGSVFSAAAAVCRSLACDPDEQWLLELYQHSPAFACISETGYRFIAHHRKLFSALTWLLWGKHLAPPQQKLVRWGFLRSLGIIYLLAFLSLWLHIESFAGSHGTAPVAVTLAAAKQNFAAQNIGMDRYRLMPTFCWFNTSDGFLNFQCAAGIFFAALLILDLAPAPCLFLLWLVYLSLTTVCAALPDFRWSNLLLETGFVTIFFAPLQLLPRRLSLETSPSRIAVWLLRWLLFRLMFASGWIKILNSDNAWLKDACELAAFGFDYVLPFAIFLPRQPRQLACFAFIVLQILILPTSDHLLFNLLTMTLCLPLLDDSTVQNWLPAKYRSRPLETRNSIPNRRHRWPVPVLLVVVALTGCAAYSQFFKYIGIHMPGPEPVVAMSYWLQPLRTFNSYRWPP